MNDLLIDGKKAAQLLGCTEAALALWRTKNRGLAYVRLGRLVRYSKRDLLNWVNAQTVRHEAIETSH